LSESENKSEELGEGVEALTVSITAHVDLNGFGSGEHLHNSGRGEDRENSQLHECSLVRSQNGTKGIKGVSTFLLDSSVEWDLAAYEVDEQDGSCPHQFILKNGFPERRFNLRHQSHEGLDEIN
jgi:hypothetical protein